MGSKPLPRSLRTKVTLGVVLPLVLILGVFTTLEYTRHRETMLANLALLASQTGQVIESDLRHQMLEADLTGMQEQLDAIGKSEGLRGVYLMDTSGRVIFAPNGEEVGTQWDDHQPNCQPCHHLPPGARPGSVVVTADDGQRVFRSVQPIENSPECTRCHDPDERLLGLLLTDISMAPMEAALAADLRENLLWWAGTIVVTVLIVNVAVSRFVLRRLEGLASAIAGFGQGQMPSPLREDQPDEISQLASAFNEMAQQVEARNVEIRKLSEDSRRQSLQRGRLLKRLITVQEDERRRVARELHDELGQSLGGLALQVEAIVRSLTPDAGRLRKQLGHVHTLVVETTDRMYDLILDLRPSALDDLGLVAALDIFAERLLADSGIVFKLDADHLTSRLPPELETTLYRCFQEAMNNVVRHAGAKRVHITLAQRDAVFEGQIEDDGQGFDPEGVRMDGREARGLGLLGIQERVTQWGGQLEIASRPGGGTRLRITIPLRR